MPYMIPNSGGMSVQRKYLPKFKAMHRVNRNRPRLHTFLGHRPGKRQKYTKRVQLTYIPVNNKNILAEIIKTPNILPWPHEINATYAISIRPERFRNLQSRMNFWKSHIKLFPGTNGRTLTPKNMYQKVAPGKNLTRGQVGCYDSHVRLWNHIAKHHNGPVLILEDDAALFYNQQLAQRFKYIFDTLQKKSINWDCIYFGHYGFSEKGPSLAPGIHICNEWHGLFCYLIKPSTAKILAQNAWPMREPVDVYVGKFIRSRQLRFLKPEPRFCYVVSLTSDTNNIR